MRSPTVETFIHGLLKDAQGAEKFTRDQINYILHVFADVMKEKELLSTSVVDELIKPDLRTKFSEAVQSMRKAVKDGTFRDLFSERLSSVSHDIHAMYGHTLRKMMEDAPGAVKPIADVVFADVKQNAVGGISSRVKDFGEKINDYFHQNPQLKEIAVFGGFFIGGSMMLTGLLHTVQALITPMRPKLQVLHNEVDGKVASMPKMEQPSFKDRAVRVIPGVLETAVGAGMFAGAVALSKQPSGPGGPRGF